MRLESGFTDPDVVAGFADFDTPAISDLMNRLFTMSAEYGPPPPPVPEAPPRRRGSMLPGSFTIFVIGK